MLIRTVPPSLSKSAEIKIQQPEKIILDSGIPLYVINSGETEVMKIEILFKAGASANKNFMIAGAANALLDDGTAHHTSKEIAEEFEYYGAYLQTESSADWASVSLFSLNKFLDKVLPIYFEIITEPVFPEKEIETFITQNKQRLQVNNSKVDYLSRKIFNQKLFGNNSAYGFYQSVEDYDKINRTSITEFHRKNYSKGVFSIIVSGKTNDDAIKLISSYAKALTASVNENHNEQKFKSETGNFFIEKKDAVQSGIRIGKMLFNKLHPDFKSLSILNTILGGYFGSRLMSNIREDKGYTYGIGSALVSLEHVGCFFITTEAGVNVRDATVREIYSEIEKLMNEPIPSDELDLVKNYLIGAFQRSIDGPFALADRFKSVLTYGLDYEYFYDYLKLISKITPSDLALLASKYLDKESFTEVIVG